MLRFVNVLYETVSQRKCWWPLILLHFANWISLQHNIDLNRILRPQGSEMFLFHAFSNMSTSRTPYDYILCGKFNLDAKHLKNQKLILQRHKNESDKHLMITFQVASSTWTTNMLRLDPTFNSDLPESKRWLKEYGARENEAFRFLT